MKLASFGHNRFKLPSIKVVVLAALLMYLPFFGLIIFSIVPPQVKAATTAVTGHKVDSPLSFEILGSVQPKDVKVTTSPHTEVVVSINKGLNPLKYMLVITPVSIFQPETDYSVAVSTPNWLGVETTRQINFKTAPLPKVITSTPAPGANNVGADTNLIFEFNAKAPSGDYIFTANPNFPFALKKIGSLVSVLPLTKLKQGQTYHFTLSYSDNNSFFAELTAGSFSTINPLHLLSSNPDNNAKTVLKQTSFLLNFDKPVVKESLENNFTVTPTTPGSFSWTSDKNMVFTPTNTLATNTNYTITLGDQVKATDKSELPTPIKINFSTAGPAKIISASPTGTFASLASVIRLTFDQPVDPISAQQHFSTQPPLGGSFSWNGNSLIFKPKSLMPLTRYQVQMASGVVSIGGENSLETRAHTFTTTGERVTTIGYSVRKRAITAYYFGKGAKKILLVGSLHGTESNTGTMLSSWISYLRANQTSIGEDRTFIIVPFANPDGRASRSRFNAHAVDLNRNFGTPDWQTITYWQNRSYPKGGGSGPFSEPEARALRDLIIRENPSRIITYHSAANLVLGDGIAQSFGDWYAAKTGYKRGGSDKENESGVSALGYKITGTLEEWATLRGQITLVVEFISATSSEYSRNLPALKSLLKYPL